jgi:hypothetical protein
MVSNENDLHSMRTVRKITFKIAEHHNHLAEINMTTLGKIPTGIIHAAPRMSAQKMRNNTLY